MAWDTKSATVVDAPRRPRLRTILLLVNLLILLLPLGGIAVLRLHEDELIRGTEAQLLGQGALVREVFREAYLRARGSSSPAPPSTSAQVLLPQIDVSKDPVLPAGAPATAGQPPDPTAAAAGVAIEAAIEAAARDTLVGIRVVDRRGVVVATTGSEGGLSLAARDEVARALRGERASLLRERVSDNLRPPLESLSRGLRYRVFVALPVTLQDEGVVGAVVLSRTPLDIRKALYLHRRALGLGAAVLLAVVVAVSAVTALTIVRPARTLMQRAERVARGERGLAVTLDEPGTREMAQLARAIEAMARTLEQRADYIRTFASHVSHEFKTPLTSIRGTVELLRDHLATTSPEERERLLTILGSASDRLERLVRRLLDLARADMTAPTDECTDVASALEAAAATARRAGLDVTVNVADDLGSVRMPPEALEEVLANLLDNARVHGGPHVKVLLAAHRDGDASSPTAKIVVSDDGVGVSEANASRIFTPFFTTAREAGGSGLGLSIVRSLLENHGGSLRLEPTPRGATFIVRIPLDVR